MARLHFTPNLERHLGLASLEVKGATLGEALEHAFSEVSRARGYVMDDQGHVRHHVAVFVDGELVQDRVNLAVPIAEDSQIWLMQALSGG
jgi:NifU-like protein involved in Fe-S cluster formation